MQMLIGKRRDKIQIDIKHGWESSRSGPYDVRLWILVCFGTVAGCGKDGNEFMISGFRRDVDEIYPLLGYYAV